MSDINLEELDVIEKDLNSDSIETPFYLDPEETLTLIRMARRSLKLEEAIERGLDDDRHGIAINGEDLKEALTIEEVLH